MTDLLTGAAALGTALKAAMDITDGLLKSDGGAKFNAQVIELQRIILASQREALATQQAEFALLHEKGALEAELARMKTWDREKERYELKPVREDGKGPMAYAVKPEAQGTEPAHWICPTCYQEREKSLLQPETRQPGLARTLECHRCGLALYVHGVPHPEHTKSRPRR